MGKDLDRAEAGLCAQGGNTGFQTPGQLCRTEVLGLLMRSERRLQQRITILEGRVSSVESQFEWLTNELATVRTDMGSLE